MNWLAFQDELRLAVEAARGGEAAAVERVHVAGQAMAARLRAVGQSEFAARWEDRLKSAPSEALSELSRLLQVLVARERTHMLGAAALGGAMIGAALVYFTRSTARSSSDVAAR